MLECYTLLGESDFLLRIIARDIKDYEAFFLDHLSRIAGVQSVSSSIALSIDQGDHFNSPRIGMMGYAAATRQASPPEILMRMQRPLMISPKLIHSGLCGSSRK